MTPRVRMAPSPTGLFHVGSARTALFNFLFARHHGGAFVLRIEDTDQTRGGVEFERVIFEALEWLGLNSDEGPLQGGEFGPYRQSERGEFYGEAARALVESGQAYYAFETPEELAALREDQARLKLPPRYNGAHRDLSPAQQERFRSEGRRGVLRLRVPESGVTAWEDEVYGAMEWKNADLDDFVLLKSDGGPTYNFACAVDDHLMRISHVIRGEDGLSNTPRQLLILRALGWQAPRYAHLPFLLGADRKKLSKRNADTVSLLDFAHRGIFADAMFNFLAFLGWNPGGGQTREFYSRAELIEAFTLEGVNRAGAIFDPKKLDWMNAAYLKALPIEEFRALSEPHLQGLDLAGDPDYTRRSLDMARQRIHHLADIRATAIYFFTADFPFDAVGLTKHATPESGALLAELRARLRDLTSWDAAVLEGAVRDLAQTNQLKAAAIVHPTRLAVSGVTVGPSLWELLETLGRNRVLERLARVVDDGWPAPPPASGS